MWQPLIGRWDPLGATSDDTSSSPCVHHITASCLLACRPHHRDLCATSPPPMHHWDGTCLLDYHVTLPPVFHYFAMGIERATSVCESMSTVGSSPRCMVFNSSFSLRFQRKLFAILQPLTDEHLRPPKSRAPLDHLEPA